MRTTAETLPATLVALCSKFVLYEIPELDPRAETHLGGWFELHLSLCMHRLAQSRRGGPALRMRRLTVAFVSASATASHVAG